MRIKNPREVSEIRFKKVDSFSLERSKNHRIRNFLRNRRLRVNKNRHPFCFRILVTSFIFLEFWKYRRETTLAFVKLCARVAYGICPWFFLEIKKNKMILFFIFFYLYSDAKKTEKLLNLPLDERFATRSAFLFWDRFFFQFFKNIILYLSWNKNESIVRI